MPFKNLEDRRAYPRKWGKENKDKRRKYALKDRLKRNFNISLEEYESLVLKQNGKCAICEEPPKNSFSYLSVDHNHDTQEIRGLLCVKCNSGIGLLGDSIAHLEKAIEYLRN